MNAITIVRRPRAPDDDVCSECGEPLPDDDVLAVAGGRRGQRAEFCSPDCLNEWINEQADPETNEGRVSVRTAENLLWQMGTRGPEMQEVR